MVVSNAGATNQPDELERHRGLVKRSTTRRIPRKMADKEEEEEEEEQGNDEEQEQKDVIDRQIRTHKALLHMEMALQLPNSTVMPVLLRLMKAYDGNWEFIEADNYHVLVDAIFSMQESDEAEKAPGSSSGSAKRGGKRDKRPGRGAPRRGAPRSSKRAESDGDDSDENDGSQELVRKIRARGPARIAMPIASGEARRKTLFGDEEGDAAWGETVLALPAPLRSAPPQPQQQLALPSGTLGRLRRLSAGKSIQDHPTTTAVNKETQTDAECFIIPEAIQFKEPMNIPPTALICYEEVPYEAIPSEYIPYEEVPAEENMLPADHNIRAEYSNTNIPKQEPQEPPNPVKETPVFLSDLEVRRLLHGHAAPELCKTCEKPRSALRFDPSKVKAEPYGTDASMPPSPEGVPTGCFNPEPLQAMVPVALDAKEDRDVDHMEFEVTDPAEPLLLTFPATEPAPEVTSAATIAAELVAARVFSEPIAATNSPAIVELVLAPISPALVAAISPASVTEPAAATASSAIGEPVVVQSVVDEQLQATVMPGFQSKPATEELPGDITNCPNSLPLVITSDSQSVVVPSMEPASMVEDHPSMESGLLPRKEGVVKSAEALSFLVPKDAEPEEELRQQQNSGACENSTTQGALAALGSYISESDDHSDVDMLVPRRAPFPFSLAGELVILSAQEKCTGAHELHGILPLPNVANISSQAISNFPEQIKDSWVVVEVKQTLPMAVVPSATIDTEPHDEASSEAGVEVVVAAAEDAARAAVTAQKRSQNPTKSDSKQHQQYSSEGNTSSESSRKRKRTLTKLKDLATKPQTSDQLQPPNSPHELGHEHPWRSPQGLDPGGPARPRRHDYRDISRGKEKVPISLHIDACATNNNSVPPDLPPDFCYVNASVVYQSAHVGISMARIGEDDRCSGCIGNCLDNQVPCECARLTDGEYAYTVEGCLYPHFLSQEIERKRGSNLLSYCQPGACPMERTNDEVCRGHVQRRFIKECWEKCGCSMACGNRTVQRGIAHRLQVFWTGDAKGWGIRTLEALRAGTFVCEYVGEILTNTEMWHRNNDVHGNNKHHFSLQLDADWCSERYLKDEEALCLDGTCFGNVARFINHRCFDSNLIEIPVEIENPDHHYYHLAFFTSKDVKENEELTWDYNLDFNDKDHQIQAFECFCGSTYCRGKMEGKPWV